MADFCSAVDNLEEVYPGERGKQVDAQYKADPMAVQAHMSAERVTPY